MSYQGKKNQYICNTCKHVITTVDADDGTTSMTIPCTIEGCRGYMRSQFYMVDQSLIPSHEWYKPKGKLKNKMRKYRDHVSRGGLLIRPIQKVIPTNDEEEGGAAE